MSEERISKAVKPKKAARKAESSQKDREEKEVEWKTIKLIVPYLLMYPKRLLLVSALLVTAKLAEVSLPIIMKGIVNSLESTEAQVIAGIVAMVIFYGLIKFSATFLEYLRDFSFAKISETTRSRITLKVFKHLHSLNLEYHMSRKTGGLSQDISRGTNAIGFLLRFLLFRSVPNVITIILVLSILLSLYHWQYALIVGVSMLTYILYSFIVTEWQNKYQRISNELDSASNSRAIDSLLNYETVKYFNNEEHEYDVYRKKLNKWEVARLRTRFSTMILNSGQSLIIALSVTILLLITVIKVYNKSLSIGDLVLVHSYIVQLFVPLGFLGFVYMETKNSLASISRMMRIMNVSTDVKDLETAKDIDIKEIVATKFIEFNKVDFSYNIDRKILDSLSFSIAHNKRVGIVGSTGSGKTTIGKLLFRFYDLDSGVIKVNGQDIKAVTQSSLRQLIGFVPQDTVLFNDSIYYNLQYGDPKASKEQILEAIEIADLSAFIKRLPQGLDTVVGERGLKLSGGEKQRIAIARVILKNPHIIIFDEATSALDSKTEKNIIKSFNKIAKSHTSIIIAHRLSTIVDADKILVLDQGRLIEEGTHQELLSAGGIYQQLWTYQQNEEKKEAEPQEQQPDINNF